MSVVWQIVLLATCHTRWLVGIMWCSESVVSFEMQVIQVMFVIPLVVDIPPLDFL